MGQCLCWLCSCASNHLYTRQHQEHGGDQLPVCAQEASQQKIDAIAHQGEHHCSSSADTSAMPDETQTFELCEPIKMRLHSHYPVTLKSPEAEPLENRALVMSATVLRLPTSSYGLYMADTHGHANPESMHIVTLSTVLAKLCLR